PRRVVWRRKQVTTGIYKEPVEGSVRVGGLNLDGDGQADLTVHGGADKAVLLYRAEHYPHWQEQLGRTLVVTQPRLPCFKLGLRFGDPRMVGRSSTLDGAATTCASRRKGRLRPATRSSSRAFSDWRNENASAVSLRRDDPGRTRLGL